MCWHYKCFQLLRINYSSNQDKQNANFLYITPINLHMLNRFIQFQHGNVFSGIPFPRSYCCHIRYGSLPPYSLHLFIFILNSIKKKILCKSHLTNCILGYEWPKVDFSAFTLKIQFERAHLRCRKCEVCLYDPIRMHNKTATFLNN